MTTRQYSSRSQQSTLTSAITSGTTSMTVVSGTGLLGGVTIPSGRTFTLVLDPDTAIEEIIDATAVSTNTFTITRAVDGSTAQDHSAGAVVRHMAIGRDFRDANLHAEADASYNDGSGTAHTMHGISSGEGVVVGTLKTQTLTNKTLTSPTISNPTITGTSGVETSIVFEGSTADDYETTLTVVDPTQDNTITLPNTTGTVVLATAVQTLTNKTLTSPTISGSPVITGLSSAGMVSSSATPKDYVDSILGSATAAATSAASAATSAASAATSATSAANSATASATSASASATSATAAATSATSAAASATAAATSATSAATSATSAAASATTASNSASAAATSATSASNSATASATSASAAATSATSAAASATSAANSASAAATSATSAAASATAAATSATSAATSATSAAASAASAAAVLAGAIQANILDAKGDLIVASAADTAARLAVATTNGYVLSVNSGTATGLEWIAPQTGDITGVTAGTGLSGGGTSGDVTLNLANTAVTAGAYTYTSLTVDAQGRLTAASNGTAPVTSVSAGSGISVTGTTTPTVAIDSTVATTSGTQTLTNKTLTAPIISTISNTGTVTLPTATDTLVGRATTDTLTNKTIALGSNTVSGTIAQFNTALTDGDFATLAGAETLTNKTISGANNTLTVRLDNTDVTGTLVATKGGTGQSTYAAGDILYASATNTLSKLAKGTDGQILTLASGVPSWATSSGPTDISVRAYTGTTGTSFTTTYTSINFDAEDFDTDSMHSTSSNSSRITFNTAGKYVVGSSIATGGNISMGIRILLNGSTNICEHRAGNGGEDCRSVSTVYNFAANDYIEVQCISGNTTTTVQVGTKSNFWAKKI